MDLQSTPFDRSGISPNGIHVARLDEPMEGLEPTTYGLQIRCSTS